MPQWSIDIHILDTDPLQWHAWNKFRVKFKSWSINRLLKLLKLFQWIDSFVNCSIAYCESILNRTPKSRFHIYNLYVVSISVCNRSTYLLVGHHYNDILLFQMKPQIVCLRKWAWSMFVVCKSVYVLFPVILQLTSLA